MKRRDIFRTALGAAALGIAPSIATAQDTKKTVVIPRKPVAEPREMVYRPLGKTGIRVSILGFGSHLSDENLKDPKGRDRQIQEALENGVNLFDIYDHSIFHQFAPMSKSLEGKRDKAVISLVAVKPDVRKEVEGALTTFKTDHIDLYRIVYRDADPHTKGDADLDILFKLRDESKIRAVGVVAHDEPGVLYAVENKPVDYIMMPMNFHRNKGWTDDKPDTYSKVLPLCRQKGIGVLGIKPMGGDTLVAFAQWAGFLGPKYRGPSYPKAALRWLWKNDLLSSSLPSLNSVGEVWDALDAVWRPELTKDDEEVLRKLDKTADKTLGK